MSANAGELREIMEVRLKMQEDGITNPSESVKQATRALVEKLAEIDPSERIDVTVGNSYLARYIRSSSGEVLAEIHETNT